MVNDMVHFWHFFQVFPVSICCLDFHKVLWKVKSPKWSRKQSTLDPWQLESWDTLRFPGLIKSIYFVVHSSDNAFRCPKDFPHAFTDKPRSFLFGPGYKIVPILSSRVLIWHSGQWPWTLTVERALKNLNVNAKLEFLLPFKQTNPSPCQSQPT